MNKKILLACLLVMSLMLSSCALIVTDAAVDAATPIVTVGETVYTKAEVNQYVTNYLNNQVNYEYQNYGFVFTDVDSPAAIASAQDAVIDMLVEEAVVHNKSVELGVEGLTEDEQAEIDSMIDMSWDYYVMFFGTPTDLTDDNMAAYKSQAMATIFGVTPESMTEEAMHEKLKEKVTGDVTVTEDEVVADFNTHVDEAKAAYELDPSEYGSAVNASQTVYYRPEGYRMVKNLLIQFNPEDKATMTDLRGKASTQENAAGSYLAMVNANGDVDIESLASQVTVELTVDPEDPYTYTATVTGNTFEPAQDEEEQTLIDNVIGYVQAKALANKYTEMADDATAVAYANIAPKADEALAMLADGADWDEVMAQYTMDPGMQAGSAFAATGYAVCENMAGFDSLFVNAAMGLTTIGEHTDKVPSDLYGYYIIQYTSDVEAGPVNLDDVRAVIEDELLHEKKDAAYDAAVTQWKNEADVKIDKKPLK